MIERTAIVGTGVHLVGCWIMVPTVEERLVAALVEEVRATPGGQTVEFRFAPMSCLLYPIPGSLHADAWAPMVPDETVTLADPGQVYLAKVEFQIEAERLMAASNREDARTLAIAGIALSGLATSALAVRLAYGQSPAVLPYVALVAVALAGITLLAAAVLARMTWSPRRSLIYRAARDLRAGRGVRLHDGFGDLRGVEGEPSVP